jgi:hypothetical protein
LGPGCIEYGGKVLGVGLGWADCTRESNRPLDLALHSTWSVKDLLGFLPSSSRIYDVKALKFRLKTFTFWKFETDT